MNGSQEIAARLGITSLFHYQKFEPDHLADVLQNHRIFCSNPLNFNDPWDCKPYFDPDLVVDAETHAATAQSFIQTQRGGPRGDQEDEILRRNPAAVKMLLLGLTEEFLDFIPRRWGMYCLAESPCSTLMWSHYGCNHTGVCLEFSSVNSKFGFAYKVHYQEEYPPLLLYQEASRLTVMLIKSDVWAYEKEFRLICPRFTDVPNHPLLLEGNYLTIGPSALKSIIVGCQADYDAISKLVRRDAPRLRVRRALRAANRYRLLIRD